MIDLRSRTIRAFATGVLLTVGLTACTSSGPDESSPQGKKIAELGDAQEQAEKQVPYPEKEMTFPLTRQNISKRLIRMNDPNHISYVYHFTIGGVPLGYYVIKGQLTPVGAQLNPDDTIIDACNKDTEYCPQLVTAAGDDNTYGDNGKGWFGFTAQDVMVTIDGGVITQSDAPINIPSAKDLTPQK